MNKNSENGFDKRSGSHIKEKKVFFLAEKLFTPILDDFYSNSRQIFQDENRCVIIFYVVHYFDIIFL